MGGSAAARFGAQHLRLTAGTSTNSNRQGQGATTPSAVHERFIFRVYPSFRFGRAVVGAVHERFWRDTNGKVSCSRFIRDVV